MPRSKDPRDPRNVPLEEFSPAVVRSISQCGSVQYGRVVTYRSAEMRQSSGQLVARYESPEAIMARLEYEEGWVPISVTMDPRETWYTIFLRRDLSVLPRRAIDNRAQEP